jgi:YggT family protein
MFIVDILFSEVGRLVSGILWLYSLVVIAAVLVTWVSPDPWNPIVRFLRRATEPVFARVRRWIPFVVIGGLDLSPLVVLVGIRVVDRVINEALWRLARGF